MVALHKCFEYAKKQFLGMQFREFSFSYGGKSFWWEADPRVVTHILKKLERNQEELAFKIFKKNVEEA